MTTARITQERYTELLEAEVKCKWLSDISSFEDHEEIESNKQYIKEIKKIRQITDGSYQFRTLVIEDVSPNVKVEYIILPETPESEVPREKVKRMALRYLEDNTESLIGEGWWIENVWQKINK